MEYFNVKSLFVPSFIDASLPGQFMWHEFWYTVAHFTPVDISKMEGNPLSRLISAAPKPNTE